MISDLDARATALEVDRSFIVQAPAGSGKTGLLVYRMLALLATVEQPQQVLAITFTRKATAEMRERLLELLTLAENSHNSDDDFEQQGIDLAAKVLARDTLKEWKLLNSPHQLQILTIDSFCAKLTSSMPWLSRLGDRPRTTDNAEAHYAAAVEQLLTELLDKESAIIEPLTTVLNELDFNYTKARQLFSSILAKRDQWLRHLLQNDLSSLRTELESSWQHIVDSQLCALRQSLGDDCLSQLIELATGAAQVQLEKYPGEVTPLAIFAEQAATSRSLTLAHWRGLTYLLLVSEGKSFRKTVNIKQGFIAKSKPTQQLKDYLAEFADDAELLTLLASVATLPDVHYSEPDWQQLIALEKVLKALAARLQLRFRAAGECDHSEVTQRANLALHELDNPTDLGLRMDYSLQHILVDEFQDTSNGQIELLKKLTAGWSSQSDGAAKTLFLVGDPMQSIYRFREADVSLFLQVANNQHTQVFDNLKIEPLQLSTNFRSTASLVNWFNQTFRSSFPAVNDVLTGAICYAQATSSEQQSLNALADVDYLLAHDKQQEAQLLVDSVNAAIDDLPDSQAQVAILVRSRSQLAMLLPSLQRAGIGYLGVDIQALRDQQAVIDVLALCKAICREDDRVAWLALLRGPWCGLSLLEIKQLVGRADLSVWRQLAAADISVLSEPSAQRLAHFCTVITGTLEQRQQVELASLTRWAWRNLGGEQTLFGTSIDDIETVFELIESLQRGGDICSMNDLDKALDGLFAKPVNDAASPAKVVVSTMHKAKGLQFDTVILPSLSSPPRADDKSLLMWAELQLSDGDSGLLLAPLRLTPSAADHYSYLRKLEAQRAANETIRLMYVAATRAERKLILLATARQDEESGQAKAPRHNSVLGTVWDALQGEFKFVGSAAPSEEPNANLNQTLHRLPADYVPSFANSIEWQVEQQLNTAPKLPEHEEDSDEQSQQELEYEWATAVATGVGIVLHDWLQHNSQQLFTKQANEELDHTLVPRWRAELLALRVPLDRINYAVKRLERAVANIRSDENARFLFANYPEQQNEYTVSSYEDGRVNRYRIDRTFVDANNVRWIVDYKSTDTNNPDVDAFVDEQVASRHRAQLQKYAQMMSQIDQRPIKLAVYFPLLKKLRSWSYSD